MALSIGDFADASAGGVYPGGCETSRRRVVLWPPAKAARIEHLQADWNRGEDPNRHGLACPGDLSRQGAGRGGADKPGHDGVAASAAFPVSLNTV
jgi:hypothetical protein